MDPPARLTHCGCCGTALNPEEYAGQFHQCVDSGGFKARWEVVAPRKRKHLSGPTAEILERYYGDDTKVLGFHQYLADC